MAQSRLEKIGTIFTRVSGLLRAEAMKVEDKPIWYDVYEKFPPKLEPHFARPTPDYIKIKDIFYADDISRAKFHKTNKQQETVNLLDTKTKTTAQNFVEIYNDLKSQGALDEEQIFSTALNLLEPRTNKQHVEHTSPSQEDKNTEEKDSAQYDQHASSNINIKKLFDN